MLTIRNNVFETNSSSCHSITMISGLDYEQLEDNKKVVAGFDRDIFEHEVCLEVIEPEYLKTLDEAVEMYKDTVENFNGDVDDYSKEYANFIKSHWNTSLLKFILFEDESEIGEEINNYKAFGSFPPESYELREVLKDTFKVVLESYGTLFDGDSSIMEMKEVTSPSGDTMYMIDVDVAC